MTPLRKTFPPRIFLIVISVIFSTSRGVKTGTYEAPDFTRGLILIGHGIRGHFRGKFSAARFGPFPDGRSARDRPERVANRGRRGGKTKIEAVH